VLGSRKAVKTEGKRATNSRTEEDKHCQNSNFLVETKFKKLTDSFPGVKKRNRTLKSRHDQKRPNPILLFNKINSVMFNNVRPITIN
jgi:hypothetical protein